METITVRKLLVLGTLVIIIVAVAVPLWRAAMEDRGEILVLGSAPLPGESDRIARHRLVYVDDPEAFRERVGDDTRMIVVPESRVPELGADWLRARPEAGVWYVVILLDAGSEDEGASDITALDVHVFHRSCLGGTWEGQSTYSDWRSELTVQLDRWYLRCRHHGFSFDARGGVPRSGVADVRMDAAPPLQESTANMRSYSA